MSNRLFLPCTILFAFYGVNVFSQERKIFVTQYDHCEDIKEINLDDIREQLPDDHSLALIIFRAESSHEDGTPFITPIDSFLKLFDTTLIRIYSFELRSTKGSSSCNFKFSVNGVSDNQTKGNPPFLCITTKDDSLLRFVKNKLSLSYFAKSRRYLLFSDAYSNENGFFRLLNEVLINYKTDMVNLYRIESLEKEIKRLKRSSSHYLSLLWSPSVLNQVFVTGSTFIKKSSLLTLELTDNIYFKRRTKSGIGIGISYSEFNALLESRNIVDTVGREVFDPQGEKYMRIAYGNNIGESIFISYLGVSVSGSYKVPFKKSRGYISIHPGVKLTQILSSGYRATGGEVTWGGLYPQFDKQDTLFSGYYDFYVNSPLPTQRRRFETRPAFISAFISVNLVFIPLLKNENLFINCGFNLETGSNVLNPDPDEKLLPSGPGNHNSLAYRNNKFQINAFALKFGLTYNLSKRQ